MDYEIAEKILKQFKTTKLEDLKGDLIQMAIKYARIQTVWQCMPVESRIEIDIQYY
jgi:hypothetical protein